MRWLLPRRWSYYGWQYVKELGGEQVQTDWNQNDTTAKDYIKNRPGGYEEGFEITWDGDTTGKTLVAASADQGYALITDKILSQDDAIGATVEMSNGRVRELDSSSVRQIDSNICIIADSIIAVSNAPASLPEEFGGFTFPESGTYFVYFDDMYPKSIKKISTHKFDEKYIPDSIARKAELDSRITEKEVILTSSTTDSTKKFKITVNDSGTLTATEIPE